MLQKIQMVICQCTLVLCSDRACLCHSDTGLGRHGVRARRWTLS